MNVSQSIVDFLPFRPLDFIAKNIFLMLKEIQNQRTQAMSRISIPHEF